MQHYFFVNEVKSSLDLAACMHTLFVTTYHRMLDVLGRPFASGRRSKDCRVRWDRRSRGFFSAIEAR